jgi:hypothetical protein
LAASTADDPRLVIENALGLDDGDVHCVQIVATDYRYHQSALFVATDEGLTQPGRVFKFDLAQIDAGAVPGPLSTTAPADGEQCTALTADMERLYCASSMGKIVVYDQDLTHMSQEPFDVGVHDPNSPPDVTAAFYGAVIAGGNLFAASYTTSSVYKFDGIIEPEDCVLSDWSEWGECFDQSPGTRRADKQVLTCGHGAKYRQREITNTPKYGFYAAPCDPTEEVDSCTVTDDDGTEVECCTGGKVWGTSSYTFDCPIGSWPDAGVAATEHAVEKGCHCPESTPAIVAGPGGSTELSTCQSMEDECTAETAATPCQHMTCTFMTDPVTNDERLVVRHQSPRDEFAWAHEKTHDYTCDEDRYQHKCIHSMGRMGACTCLCWDKELGGGGGWQKEECHDDESAN